MNVTSTNVGFFASRRSKTQPHALMAFSHHRSVAFMPCASCQLASFAMEASSLWLAPFVPSFPKNRANSRNHQVQFTYGEVGSPTGVEERKKIGQSDAIEARTTCKTPDPWIKTNQNSLQTTNRSKSNWDYFCGILELGKKNQKKSWQTEGIGDPIHGNLALDTK